MKKNKAATIPEDLIIEILLRLPVKSLLQNKSVCKAWYNLIISPNFMRMHHNFSINTTQLLISTVDVVGDERVDVLSFRSNDKSFKELSQDLKLPRNGDGDAFLVGSCNGIVCFDAGSTIFLCNPSTREFKQLPPTSFNSENGRRYFKRFYPSFGFDSSDIYNFKVISLYVLMDGETECGLRGEVYTLSSNAWTQVDWSGEDMRLLDNHSPNRFCANSCHWYILCLNPQGSRQSILRFDMHTESFNRIDFPKDYISEDYSLDDKSHFLTVFKEYLAVFEYWRGSSVEQCIEIWIMKDYGVKDSWTKLCSCAPSIYSYPLSFWSDDALLLRYDDEKLISWNLDTGTFDFLKCYWVNYLEVVVHKETLVSLK